MKRLNLRAMAGLLAVSAGGCAGLVQDDGTGDDQTAGPGGLSGAPGRPPSGGTAGAPAAGTASPPPSNPAAQPGTTTGGLPPAPSPALARLTHAQWELTTRDLLRLPAAPGLSASFPSETSPSRFANQGGTLGVGSALWTEYQRAAERLARDVARDPAALARLVPAKLPDDPRARAHAVTEALTYRAYRRPPSVDEMARAVARFERGAATASGPGALAAGVEVLLEGLLQAPQFLYRTEIGQPGKDGALLDDHELASRLSYALVGTMPDDELLGAARAKTLAGSRQSLAAQARRLLATPAGKGSVESFHDHLLDLGSYARIEKDAKEVPGFVPALRDDMRSEALALIRDVVVDKGLGVAGLLTAGHTFVNARLAKVYELPGTFTDDRFVRVDLNPARRLGILTQPGFLAVHAHGLEPDIIHRGLFVAQSLLCKPLPPPLDDLKVPQTDPSFTNRQRIEAITGKGTCGEGCHAPLINPGGYALESYDGLGRYRATDRGKPVDTASALTIDGERRSFANALELARLMAASQEAHQCYARNWLEFLHARPQQDSDLPFLAALAARSRNEKLPTIELILALITSDGFVGRVL